MTMAKRTLVSTAVLVLWSAVMRCVAIAASVDEVHYTYLGPDSVAFDWRGDPTDIQYGTTTAYGTTVIAETPDPLPFSSPGPFREAVLVGLAPGRTYRYSIGGGPDRMFTTVPIESFRFDAIGDVGSSLTYPNVATVQSLVADDSPAFVLVIGDLTMVSRHSRASPAY